MFSYIDQTNRLRSETSAEVIFSLLLGIEHFLTPFPPLK